MTLRSAPRVLSLSTDDLGNSIEQSKSCVVTDRDDIRILWSQGAFGCSTRSTRFKPAFLDETKPSSSTKRKGKRKYSKAQRSQTSVAQSNEEDDELEDDHSRIREESMQLNLMETLYLQQENKLAASVTGLSNSANMRDEFHRRYSGDQIGFEQRFTAYKTFRDSGWFPKNGAQYGCDYVLYRKHPEHCHSEYCVTLEDPTQNMRTVAMLRSLRVAEQTRKRMILCDETGDCVQLKRWVLKHEQADRKDVGKDVV